MSEGQFLRQDSSLNPVPDAKVYRTLPIATSTIIRVDDNLEIKGPRPWADVRPYGAVGDGVADDRPAIQAAIDAISAIGGGIVFLPPGTYRVTNSGNPWALRIKSNVEMRGAGYASLIKLANMQVATTWIIGAPDADLAKNVTVCDLQIDGNGSNQNPTEQQHGVYLGDATDCTVSRVTISNMRGDCIILHAGLLWPNCLRCRVIQNTLIGWSTSRVGANFYGASDSICANNEFLNFMANWAMKMEFEQTTPEKHGNEFLGNVVTGSAGGISISGWGGSPDRPTDMVIAENRFDILTGAGSNNAVRLRSCDRIVVAGNRIKGAQGQAILIESDTKQIAVKHNSMTGVGNALPNPTAGIVIGSGSLAPPEDTVIEGNVVTGSPVDGIQIVSTSAGGQVKRTTIANNICVANGYRGIIVAESRDTVIVGNQIANNGQFGGGVGMLLTKTVSGNSLITISQNVFYNPPSGGFQTTGINVDTSGGVTDVQIVANTFDNTTTVLSGAGNISGAFQYYGNIGGTHSVVGNLTAHGSLQVGGVAQIGGDLVHQGTHVGFFNVTPVVRSAALVQGYSMTTRTLASYTPNTQGTAYTGIDNMQPSTVYAKVADLNSLRLAYENLRLFTENLAKVVNSVVNDLRAYGLEQ